LWKSLAPVEAGVILARSLGRKMRYLKLIVVASLLMPVSLFAQVDASKVGVINFEQAVRDSAQGKQATDDLQVFFEERRAQLEASQNELADLQQKLQTQERALSETALAELTRDIERKTTDLTRDQEDAEVELQAKQDELFRPVFSRTGEVLQDYAAAEGYAVILDTSNPQSGIIFVEEVIDITTEIIEILDAGETASPGQPPQP
jgi:outer membrane protein